MRWVTTGFVNTYVLLTVCQAQVLTHLILMTILWVARETEVQSYLVTCCSPPSIQTRAVWTLSCWTLSCCATLTVFACSGYWSLFRYLSAVGLVVPDGSPHAGMVMWHFSPSAVSPRSSVKSISFPCFIQSFTFFNLPWNEQIINPLLDEIST